jgi:hypothetical protein
LTPAMVLRSSPARWLPEPLPAHPKVICPGLAFAIETSWRRSFIGEFAAVTIMSGTVVTKELLINEVCA